MDPVGPPSLLAASGGHKIFIYIRGIQKNIYMYIYPWGPPCNRQQAGLTVTWTAVLGSQT